MGKMIMIAPGASPQLGNAVAGLLGNQGRVLQVFEGGAFIVDALPALLLPLQSIPGISAVTEGVIGNVGAVAPTTELASLLTSWNLQFDPAFAAARASRSLVWSGSPQPCGLVTAPPPFQSRAMTGDIAVGIVVVDGPAGSTAALTESERIQALLAIPQGWFILTDQSPQSAKLVFMADLRLVRVAFNPSLMPPPVATPSGADFEPREAPWRDLALQQLGFPAGQPGIEAYRQFLMTKSWPVGTPQTAVVIFVTKYQTARFAYAWEPFHRMVIDVTRTMSAVLPTDLDRVMAHETAHLFGAADEYDCSLFTLHGVQAVPNGNCAPANPFATACLMRGNADVMCNFTRGHLGWFGLV